MSNDIWYFFLISKISVVCTPQATQHFYFKSTFAFVPKSSFSIPHPYSTWNFGTIPLEQNGASTGSALAAVSDIHRQVPMNMADIHRDWLTNQNTDWCFVVIGLVGRQSHSPLLQLKIDPVCQMGLPYWLALSGCQRIFINIRGQYGIQKNIYIYP